MSDKTTTKAIRDVLDKFVHIGNCYYNGKHHDNVLNIFGDLNQEDQKILLRGVHQIYLLLESGEISSEIPLFPKVQNDHDTEVESSADYNSKMMIELKFWFFKTMGLMTLTILSLLVVIVAYFGSSEDGSGQGLTRVFKVLALMFS